MKSLIGTYRHFKGGIYSVLGNAISGVEDFIIYKNKGGLFVRSISSFTEMVRAVDLSGLVPRFQWIDEDPLLSAKEWPYYLGRAIEAQLGNDHYDVFFINDEFVIEKV